MERHDPNEPTRPDEQPAQEEEPTREEPTREQDTIPQGEPQSPAPGAAPGGAPPAGGAAPPEGPQSPAGGEPPGGAEPPPEQPAAGPRRLFRSRTDRVLGGVCGGLGRYLGVDPIVLRIVFVVLLFFGGVSLVAYLVALLFVPNEPEGGAAIGAAGAAAATGGQPPDRSRTLAIVGLVVLLLIGWPLLLGGGLAIAGIALPLAVLAVTGLAVWWLVSGEGPGRGAGSIAGRSALGLAVLIACCAVFVAGIWAAGVGGGVVAAIIVIAAGALLVVGAFLGRARPLILPALSLALGVALVSAAGIDLSGGVGEREYSPTSAAELQDEYELGMGELVVDLREANLPPGDTQLAMRIGMGEAALLVPRDVCVASSATVGAGNVASFGRDNGGVDLDWEDLQTAAPKTSRLVVDADVGFGEFRVQHGPYHGPGPSHDGPFEGDGPPFLDRDRPGDPGSATGPGGEQATGNAACAGGTTAANASG